MQKSNYVNITKLDQYLAIIYFSILVEKARLNEMLTYGELVQLAKDMYPDDELVQKSIPVSTGRRLEVIQQYLRVNTLPDLTSIVFNQATNDCGEGIGHGNPSILRDEVFKYSWDGEYENFLNSLGHQIEEIKDLIINGEKPTIRITEAKAIQMMSDHYKVYGKNYPAKIKTQREKIIRLLMDGRSVEQAFYDCSQ